MREPDLENSFDGSGHVVGNSIEVVIPPHTRKAWRCPLSEQHPACLAHWLIYSPHQHPIWQYWWVTLIHLRDIPGSEPAHKDFEGAEYEISSLAQVPSEEPNPDDAKGTRRVMLPYDINEQFGGVSDKQAVALAETWVRDIIGGRLNPDSDYRRVWKSRVAIDVEAAKKSS